MSGHIRIHGTLTAAAGVHRSHDTDRAYPFTMEIGDTLSISEGVYITFERLHVFTSRDEQNKFVDDWKHERGLV